MFVVPVVPTIPWLHQYARSDLNLRMVRGLLSRGESPNLADNHSGGTPLHFAAMSEAENTMVIRELIRCGAIVDSLNNRQFTPLHEAACYRKDRMVEILLQKGADVNARTVRDQTALHLAIDNTIEKFSRTVDATMVILEPDINIVKMLLNHKNIELNPMNYDAKTPLRTAADSLHAPSMKALLVRGANMNYVDNSLFTPLHSLLHRAFFEEIYDGSRDCTDVLLRHGANIYFGDISDRTPFQMVVEGIDDERALAFSKYFVKKVIFYRNVSQDEIAKLEPNAELAAFQRICSKEVTLMMSQVICRQLTVHDFLWGCFNDNEFYDNLCRDIYKPLVDILLTGVYSVYFYDIFNLIPKHELWDALSHSYSLINKREKSKNLDHLRFLRMCINGGRAMYVFMSHQEIFDLIKALSGLTMDQINAIRPIEL